MTGTSSVLDRIGGDQAAHRLAQAFYARVLADPVLLPLFRDPSEPHAERMGWWLVELFGGDQVHSAQRGGFATMVRAHHGLGIKEAQRAQWVAHMTAATEEVGLDPAVAAGFARYVETASRLAMNGSQQARS